MTCIASEMLRLLEVALKSSDLELTQDQLGGAFEEDRA